MKKLLLLVFLLGGLLGSSAQEKKQTKIDYETKMSGVMLNWDFLYTGDLTVCMGVCTMDCTNETEVRNGS